MGEVGAGDAAHGRGEDHEVDRRQLAPLQAQGSHLPRVQDGEEQRALQLTIFKFNNNAANNKYKIYLLLVGHAGPGDVEVGELREAGPEDVGVHPRQRHTVQGQLEDTGAWKYGLQT